MSYLYVDTYEKQSSKTRGLPCGDVIAVHRDETATTIIISDGLGSGIKANIVAHMCVSRAKELLSRGASLKFVFNSLAETMNKAWGTTEPFAVFCLVRILSNGETHILSYEFPLPILTNKYTAVELKAKSTMFGKAVIYESHSFLKPDDGLILLSDGISQAGIGNGMGEGWGTRSISRYIADHLANNEFRAKDIARIVHDKARSYWGNSKGDDCSVVFAHCRPGMTVNIISGPPKNPELDQDFCSKYLSCDGIKIVCGGTTSKLIAKALQRQIVLEPSEGPTYSPPSYSIRGIDCVTEGAVTLNQVYNIFDENLDDTNGNCAVYTLIEYLRLADRINFWIGDAMNEGSANIAFKQQHILDRQKILQLLIEKLEKMGKLIIVNRPD